MPKGYKPKPMKHIENTYNSDKPLQHNIPQGVKDDKKITEKEVFGKTKGNKTKGNKTKTKHKSKSKKIN